MTLEDIKRLDPKGMYNWIRDFPKQVEDAVRIGTKAKVKLQVKGIQNIVLTGLGGSAIGGDLLRSYLADELKVPFVVNRHYVLPAFVTSKSLVIVSSYSGNTEETISAHRDAAKRKARVLCISTNGETEKLAAKYRHPVIRIPGGLPPRRSGSSAAPAPGATVSSSRSRCTWRVSGRMRRVRWCRRGRRSSP